MNSNKATPRRPGGAIVIAVAIGLIMGLSIVIKLAPASAPHLPAVKHPFDPIGNMYPQVG